MIYARNNPQTYRLLFVSQGNSMPRDISGGRLADFIHMPPQPVYRYPLVFVDTFTE